MANCARRVEGSWSLCHVHQAAIEPIGISEAPYGRQSGKSLSGNNGSCTDIQFETALHVLAAAWLSCVDGKAVLADAIRHLGPPEINGPAATQRPA